ncbi:hypothetical protein KY334_01135 [Candidatus Woesearchaeota archaeon]|nr:hypothetical protein [Candidatus Woesearchaeota archaeon]
MSEVEPLKPIVYYHKPLECNSFAVYRGLNEKQFFLRFIKSGIFNPSKQLKFYFFREVWSGASGEEFQRLNLSQKKRSFDYFYDLITIGSCRIYDEETRKRHNHKRTVISINFNDDYSDKGDLVKKILDEHDPYGIINLKYVCIDTFIRQYQGRPPFDYDD